MKIGLDIGSTTLKCVVLDESEKIIFSSYDRHFSQITEKTAELLRKVERELGITTPVGLSISGSAGMGLAEACGIPFVQEVYATRLAVKKLIPDADVVIELGGEDAKILYLSERAEEGGVEVRMNGSCAGGTGAFIDQMASLLGISIDEIDDVARDYEKFYTIASRCGVFAKSDVQPLLNQGAKHSDVAASILMAVVNQTIGGLAQGREIKGNVVYLGGPLSFLSMLRECFDMSLNLKGICPENSLYFVSMGAAFGGEEKSFILSDAADIIERYHSAEGYSSCDPLFSSEEEYEEFKARHNAYAVKESELTGERDGFLGIDSGSTTLKAVVVDKNENIICSEYLPNTGNSVAVIKEFLEKFYRDYPEVTIRSSAATGYGEELIQNAFNLDFGLVETMAHLYAAQKFSPDVDFIIDIGGQDIKCFKVKNGVVDNIFLNEACSSGCGSFLQTFAAAWGDTIEEFAARGIFADRPVDLGSRCTVFMNSSVKQAQKDGAGLENISAGLSISVVRNALYKVIRAVDAKSLGEHIVVQGGTFLNDAVLRAFEQEIGTEVTRSSISGLMGAYGAALYAKKRSRGHSTLLDTEALSHFTHSVKATTCKACANNCKLTINTFDSGRSFIGGNRCDRPVRSGEQTKQLNLYEYKRELLESYTPVAGPRGKIGLPLVLGNYELLPYWHTFFTKLGFEVVVSPFSNRKLYLSGQRTIPSDTVCFPAKLVHGHIQWLIDGGVDTIFYPCMTYNFDEELGDNHFNCPVVAYYPEVIEANMSSVRDIKLIYDYISLNDSEFLAGRLTEILSEYTPKISTDEIKEAIGLAEMEYRHYFDLVRKRGQEYIEEARRKGMPIVVLAGRPYHLDPEVSHGIDRLVCACGAAVITEDAVSHLTPAFRTNVLNQWTYHSRLYAAAKYAGEHDDVDLVQLVSFGCGVDAITTDESREILEERDKIYTQIKIDEITNLGAVKIRLRSLFAAKEQGKGGVAAR